MTTTDSVQMIAPVDHSELSTGTLLLASVSLGLGCGLMEVGVDAVRLYLLKEPLLVSSQFVWMIPAVNVALNIALGLFLKCARFALPGVFTPGRILFALAALGFAGPMFAVPRLHWAAALVLIAGLAWRTASSITARALRSSSFLSRTAAVAGAMVLLLALGSNSWRVFAERKAIAALPTAPPDLPNVLLISLDTVRARSLSLYGYELPTSPRLEQLAADGVVFDHAISTSSWTLPSHASMFTGRFPHELSVNWKTPLDGKYPTIAEDLQSHGYKTVGFVANLAYCSSLHGLNRGFIQYRDFPVSIGQAIVDSSIGGMISSESTLRYWLDYHRVLNRLTAGQVNKRFLNWLSDNSDRPFFAFLNYMDAHEPYLPPPAYAQKFGATQHRVKLNHTPVDAGRPERWKLPPEEVRNEQLLYEAAVAYIDDQLGLLLDELENRGLLANTMVMVVADHGEHFGEHRLFGHGNSLYRSSIEVPLVVYFPKQVPSGRRIPSPVSVRNLPTTILDLAGLDNRLSFPGSSLARYWESTDEVPEFDDEIILSEAKRRSFRPSWIPLGQGNMKSLISSRYQYIWNSAGREELYDYANDESETEDLSKSEKGMEMLGEFKKTLSVVGGSLSEPAVAP